LVVGHWSLADGHLGIKGQLPIAKCRSSRPSSFEGSKLQPFDPRPRPGV
jgi:hypothetical protein